jgi:putative ABC transport system substrate-binding protein
MRRREFIALASGAVVMWPIISRAQQNVLPARVGILAPPLDRPVLRLVYPIFVAELQKLGFTEGRNLVVEHRQSDQGAAQTVKAVNELAERKVDVLFVWGAELPLKTIVASYPSIPIVVGAINYDPIEKGYVQSLARPGGTVTGIASRQPDIAPKLIELLQEAFPARKRLGLLWDAQSADQSSAAEREAKVRGLELRSLKLENPPYDFAAAFRTITHDGAQMVLVVSSTLFSQQNAKIAKLAIEHRLPAMFTLKHYVEVGGLMSYGVDFAPLMRRAASLVAKVLRGAKPADLPLEQADHFEFVINLKTAKMMGITLPTSILLRADEVIE